MPSFTMLSICWIVLISLSEPLCEKAFSCNVDSLNVQGYVGYRGYKAGYNPLASLSCTADDVDCSGSYSCTSMVSITAPTIIQCKGTDACNHVTLQSDTAVHCEAINSCAFTDISTATAECSGYASCKNAYIHGVGLINIQGALSAYQASIDSIGAIGNPPTIEVHLLATLSGFGAHLLCRSGHKCNIYCKVYSACHMFYIQCIGDCTVTTYVTPMGTTLSPITITDISEVNTSLVLPALIPNTETMPFDDTLCVVDTLNFDDSFENGGLEIVVSDTGPICCRGYESCHEVGLSDPAQIRFETQTNNDLICSARDSCRDSTFISNNGAVYCEGHSSCNSLSISDAQVVYCTGRSGCKGGVIDQTPYVVCSGHSSCEGVVFTPRRHSADVTIYFGGRSSGSSAIVYCSETEGTCNVYCGAYNSCTGATIYCLLNCNVECHAEAAHCPAIVEVISRNPTSATSNPSSNANPTPNPTSNPTLQPTFAPSMNPSHNPSLHPTQHPSSNPTANPSANPSRNPSANPSHNPTSQPTRYPSANPTIGPSSNPSLNPIYSFTTMDDPFGEREARDAQSTTVGTFNSNARTTKRMDYVLILVISGVSLLVCVLGAVALIYRFCSVSRNNATMSNTVHSLTDAGNTTKTIQMPATDTAQQQAEIVDAMTSGPRAMHNVNLVMQGSAKFTVGQKVQRKKSKYEDSVLDDEDGSASEDLWDQIDVGVTSTGGEVTQDVYEDPNGEENEECDEDLWGVGNEENDVGTETTRGS
eukprot:994804_1